MTPLKRIRVDDELWEQFGDATAAIGTNRSAALVAFMRRFVAAMSPHADRPADADTRGRDHEVEGGVDAGATAARR